MGLIDKLKGNKSGKEETAANGHKRSSSFGKRKSTEVKPSKDTAVPQLPPLSDAPVATYQVDGVQAAEGSAKDHTNSGLADVTRDLSKTAISTDRPAAERHLTDTPFDAQTFLGNKESTTDYQQTQVAPVVQEVIRPVVEETVYPIFKRDHHVIHHQTRIQPVLEQVVLPARHYVIIDGKKHEILPEAVTNYVLKSREFIPMNVKPKIIVREYVDTEPLVGPITGVGASLVNKDVMLEHQRKINESYQVSPVQPQPIPTSLVQAGPTSEPVPAVPVGAETTTTKHVDDTHEHTSLKDKLFRKSGKHEASHA